MRVRYIPDCVRWGVDCGFSIADSRFKRDEGRKKGTRDGRSIINSGLNYKTWGHGDWGTRGE